MAEGLIDLDVDSFDAAVAEGKGVSRFLGTLVRAMQNAHTYSGESKSRGGRSGCDCKSERG